MFFPFSWAASSASDPNCKGFKRMALEKSTCSHCGRPFEADGTENFHSIIVIEKQCQLQIISGSLEADALHYCSDKCMFDREEGSVAYDRYLELMGKNRRRDEADGIGIDEKTEDMH